MSSWGLAVMSGPINPRHYLLVACSTLLGVLLLQFEPLNDVDIYWQVRLGQLMLEQGQLITADPFTFTHFHDPVPTIGWLAQTIFAVLYNLGSWRAVQLVHVVLFASAFGLAGLTALSSRITVPPERTARLALPALAAALFLGWVAGASNSMVRPQSFAICCFALLMCVAQSTMRAHTRLALSVPILLIWQNCHPSVAVGVLALASLATADWITFLARRVRPADATVQSCDHVTLSLLAVAAAAAQFATPMGWQIFQTSLNNVTIARELLGVSEWLPPWDPAVRDAMHGFALAGVASLVILVRLRFRIPLRELALLTVMTFLAFQAARFVIFWAVALIPLWARWMTLVASEFRAGKRSNGNLRGTVGGLPASATHAASVLHPASRSFHKSPRACILCILLLACAAFVVPSAVQAGAGDRFALTAGIARLKQRLPAGRIYNYREWGGPLILAGHPGWRVLIDGRLYMYTPQEWHAYNEAALGRVPLQQLVEALQPDAFFLRPGFHDGLVALLSRSGAWHEEYRDGNCIIFLRGE